MRAYALDSAWTAMSPQTPVTLLIARFDDLLAGGLRELIDSDPSLAIVAADVDFRVGGNYRYVFRRTDGKEFSFTGVYREIGEDSVVHTERFDDNPDEATITTTWAEHEGKTTMTLVMRFSSQAVRDMVVATGMESGAAESYDNLAALVAKL